ncbi:MAG: FapA family protein [Synergistaceae bacterium]|nr:FapA family protein [Synergistaceae bacterium]
MSQGFDINFAEDGVFLVVTPDCSASTVNVISALKEKGVTDYDGGAIKSALENKLGAPVRVASHHKEEAKDADFRMKISEDGLTCEMWLIPPSSGGAKPTLQSIKGFMNSRGVVYGHDEKAIEEMISVPLEKQWVVTARGDTPQNGRDARIDYKIDLNVLKPRAVGDKVDMKELGTVINVIQGQEIAEKFPLVQGKDGMSVTGKKISAYTGKDKNLPSGKGTVISEDKLHLCAEYDGNVIIKGGSLSVNLTFDVKGDVDYSVGNIDFIGPVMVHGSVREGFEVSSGSDIIIDGVVEGAAVKSEGSITIKIGVRGTGKANLIAKGDVNAGYIDQARVRSSGNIAVAEAILHSDIGARGEVSAMGSKKGQIVGGTIKAGSDVLCEVLGSEMGTKTDVIVGELPELAEERKRNQENVKQFEEQLGKIDANISFLKNLQQLGQLTEDKQETLARITKAKFQIKAQHDATKRHLDELERDLDKNKLEGRVCVKNACHPGVSVMIRGVRYIVRETLRFVKFIYEDGEIKLRSFD